jgi:hypothetical protein
MKAANRLLDRLAGMFRAVFARFAGALLGMRLVMRSFGRCRMAAVLWKQGN